MAHCDPSFSTHFLCPPPVSHWPKGWRRGTMRYSGKVVIVTGGGVGGMGAAMARGLAERGLKVVVADISEEKGRASADALTADGHDAIYLPVDIASPESAAALAAKVADRYGRIDYLVNNAALFGGMEKGGLLSMDWDRLMHHFQINLFGSLAVTRAVVPY